MHFLSFTLFSSDAKADKMAATKAAKKESSKAAKKESSSSGSTHHSLIGFWTAIDTVDGSTLRLSISCDDTGECFFVIHNVT